MMHCLEMQKLLTGAGIKRQEAIGIKVVARPVAAVEFVFGGGNGKVCDAALRIDRYLAPDVHAAHVFVSVFRPRFIAGLSRTGNCMEDPEQFTGDSIEGANISGRRQITLTGRTSQDDDVLKDSSWIPGRQRPCCAVQAGFQIQLSMIGERVDKVACQRVDGLQRPTLRNKDASVFAVLAFPIIRAALSGDSTTSARGRAE